MWLYHTNFVRAGAKLDDAAKKRVTAQKDDMGAELAARVALSREMVDFLQTELPAVTLMARIHAPAALVAEVVSHPENYGAFMPALDEVEVRTRQGLQVAYSWHWTVAIFTLRGDNVMTVYPGHPTRGHLIEVTSTNGDLGVGRFLFRIYPETPDSCVLVFATRIDMRDANYLSQQMASGGNSVNRTINIALAMTMLLAFGCAAG